MTYELTSPHAPLLNKGGSKPPSHGVLLSVLMAENGSNRCLLVTWMDRALQKVLRILNIDGQQLSRKFFCQKGP